MNTDNYLKNAHKAAQAERDGAFDVAAVFWCKAENSPCGCRAKHWAMARREACQSKVIVEVPL